MYRFAQAVDPVKGKKIYFQSCKLHGQPNFPKCQADE